MMNLRSPIVAAVLAVLVPTISAQDPHRFRVVSYNVLVGFQNHRVGSPYRPGTERKKNIVSWLADQAPDVVALQEMNGYDEGRLRGEATGWGHPYAVMLKTSGYPTALTSKRPIVVVERKLQGLHHGMMVCRTCGIDFVVVHLWPFKGDERLREVKVALTLAAKSREEGRSVVVLGDFNAVSPADIPRFSPAAHERYAGWRWEMRGDKPDTSVMESLLATGLVDAYAKHREETGPLPLPRIDFVLASPDLAETSTGARWITDADALKNSDHPAVVADFERELPRFPGYPEQDALAYTFDLDVDPVSRTVKGTIAYRFRGTVPLDRVFLDGRRGKGWSVGFEDMAGETLATRWVGERAIVMLPGPVAAGDEIRFQARISGTPPDGFYFKNGRHGEALGFTDHYSIRARGWFPCEDNPGDRARFRATVRCPEGNAVVVSGVPVAPSDRTALSYETRSDIPPYMFAICVGPYARIPESGDARLLPHYVYAQDVEKAKKSLVHHAGWMKAMETAFGPYPYGKYTTIQCPTRWGGFEAPGNVQLSERLFDGPDGGVGILAHEFAHMWFGDGIGYAEWREVWLSEGFASYFGPWLHAGTGGPTLKESMSRMRDRWRQSADGRLKSIRWDGFPHPDRALNANTYPKGAWVLHMLRGELGDERFFAALRAYCDAFRGTSVRTKDLVRLFEESSGEELDWFFDQWLNRVGCPVLRIEATSGGILVEQARDARPYRFRLPLQWTDTDGTKVKRMFEIKGIHTLLVVKNVRDLVVDPDVELLFRRQR